MKVEEVLFVISSIDLKNNRGNYIDLAYSVKGPIRFDEIDGGAQEAAELITANRIGPFDNEEELLKFAYGLSEQSKLSGVCVCNAAALNEALNEVNNTSVLNEVLLSMGDVLENPEQRKKGLFSGLF